MAEALISRQQVCEVLAQFAPENYTKLVEMLVVKLPAVDAVEVVRCAQCEHGIWDEEGLWMCVFTADYDEELGVYHGFIQHNTADYYCADGKRREENESNA